MRGILAGLVVGCVIAGAVACGGKQSQPPDWQVHLHKSNEITALWTQIRQWRSEAKMELEPPVHLMQSLRGKSVRDAAKVCKADHRETATCSDICSLADAICDNAEAICGIAAELGNDDDFAQQKCTSAKASCREAKQRCCGCSETPPPSTSGGASTQGSLW